MIQCVTQGIASQDTPRDLPHILLVVDGFPKTLGGGERIVLRLAELLPRYGYTASILTFKLDPESEFDPTKAPCPVYLLPLTSTYNLQAVRGAFAFGHFLREHKVRLVLTFFESSDVWAGFVTKTFSRAKLVWNRRDMGILRSRKHRFAYRALNRFPDAVAAVSKRVAQHVLSQDGVQPQKIHVIYNGLDLSTNEFASPEMVMRRPGAVVTTVGNIRHVKGHDVLVQAASEVHKRHPAVHFAVAGDVLEEEYYQELKERVNTLGIADIFHFIGKITDLRSHLKKASIFVLPSRSEGFSNALVEAMAAGVPSIATAVGGNEEAIEQGSTGLLVPAEDVQALTEAIECLIDDPILAERLGSAGQQAVQERFSSAAMMQSLTELFSTLLRS